MEKIRVVIENKQKVIKVPTGIRMLIRRCCNAVLVLEGFEGNAEVDVSIVSDEQIQAINAEHRKLDMPTDVLSFPLGENGVYDVDPATGAKLLGDIVISIEHAEKQANDFGHSLQREIGYLTVHSMLHLLGYDHVNDESERREMRKREEQVLKIMGLEIRKED